ncbi:hypothetical protein GF348_12850 [candidate division KSB3 bacterium]|nr:hypothetical protein [candidate division KSB3 bacterium]
MEQSISLNIPRAWMSDVPEDPSILQHVFRLGVYQYRVERALQLYRDNVGSLGYIAERVHLSKQEIIREFRSRGIEPEFSEATVQEELGA